MKEVGAGRVMEFLWSLQTVACKRDASNMASDLRLLRMGGALVCIGGRCVQALRRIMLTLLSCRLKSTKILVVIRLVVVLVLGRVLWSTSPGKVVGTRMAGSCSEGTMGRSMVSVPSISLLAGAGSSGEVTLSHVHSTVTGGPLDSRCCLFDTGGG